MENNAVIDLEHFTGRVIVCNGAVTVEDFSGVITYTDDLGVQITKTAKERGQEALEEILANWNKNRAV